MEENNKGNLVNPQFAAMMDSMDDIGSALRELVSEQKKAPDIKQHFTLVKTSPETFDSMGYKYFGIVVAAPQTIWIRVSGLLYDLPLDAGFNPITLLHGAEYYGAAEFQALFVWSSVDIADTPIGTISKNEAVTLQDVATTAINGTEINVAGYSLLTFEISGTSTARTIVFEAAAASGAWIAIQAVKLSDFTTATQTTGTAELWQVDLTGLSKFRTRLSTVPTGGNVTVKGRLTA